MTRSTPLDASSLLARWREAGFVTPEATASVAEAIVATTRDAEPPIYLKLLTAVGTFFATIFFLGFLAISKLISFDSGQALIGWGIVFLLGGMARSWSLLSTPVGLARDFSAQSAFVGLALGKVLIVAGAMMVWGKHSTSVATLALLAVTIASYPVSGSSLDRILSPYAVSASALYDLIERGGDATAGLTLFHLVATAIAGGILLSHRVPVVLRPIGLAALGAMGTVVCILASGHDFGIWVSHRALDARPIEAILALSLVGLVAWTAGGVGRLTTPPLILAVVGILAIGAIGAPGLIFALMLLLLGHALHDVPLRVVGVLALPAFLVLWYYGRDMTFLVKSAALVGSGLVLLGARGAMALMGWDREDAA